jgi:hypothetical protein
MWRVRLRARVSQHKGSTFAFSFSRSAHWAIRNGSDREPSSVTDPRCLATLRRTQAVRSPTQASAYGPFVHGPSHLLHAQSTCARYRSVYTTVGYAARCTPCFVCSCTGGIIVAAAARSRAGSARRTGRPARGCNGGGHPIGVRNGYRTGYSMGTPLWTLGGLVPELAV